MTAAFKIGPDEFPIPTKFMLTDGPLVFDATGLEFDEFAERIDAMEEGSTDIRALTGLVAVAVSRGKPSWSRAQVVKYLGGVDLEAFAVEGGDDGPPAVPPAAAAESPSPVSSTESITSPVDTSGVPV